MSTCPSCGCSDTAAFYEARQVPVNSVLTLRSREEALAFPRGDIELRHCSGCGFVFNAAFDPELAHYGSECEETQGYSATFRAFELELANGLIRRHGLQGKRILEIGCGKGDFLALLCRLGSNSGVGYDPAFVEARRPADSNAVEYVAELYGEDSGAHNADLIYSKMTLEHIAAPCELLRTIRRSIPASSPAALAIQVPDWKRIAHEQAFWDIYYEHCSYFTADSLAHAFRAAGFRPEHYESLYGGQYVAVDGRPAEPAEPTPLHVDATPVERFQTEVPRRVRQWREAVSEAAKKGPVALWGGGSKAVAFLTTLGLSKEVSAVVDINPYRQGTWTAGSGHPIVAPAALVELRPATVFVMNPIYEAEIRQSLNELGVVAKTVAVSAGWALFLEQAR